MNPERRQIFPLFQPFHKTASKVRTATSAPDGPIADAIKDFTHRNDIVLDNFCGSGATLLAAERVGRRGYGLEIAPQFVDVAVRRWQRATARDAVHAAYN